jgi:hypothetical protein
MFHYFTLLFSLLLATSCGAQDPNKELKKLYPNAKKVEWNSDRNGNQEAHFKMNGSHYRADFTQSGVWIETERSIEWKDLPPAVKHTVKEHADKDDIVELEEVHHHKKGWFYDVEVEKKKKGKRDLVIAPDGQLIDKEEWK